MGESVDNQEPSLCGVLLAISAAQLQARKLLTVAAAEVELSYGEATLLLACHRLNRKTAQQELIDRCGVSAAQVSSLIERLRTRGLVEGVRLETDRRRQFWECTGEGRRVATQLKASLDDSTSRESFDTLFESWLRWRNLPHSTNGRRERAA